MRPGKKRLLFYAAVFVFGGTAGCGLSLLNYGNAYCTTFERGWPLGIVVYPCECEGYRNIAWYVSVPGLIFDTAMYGALALALVVYGIAPSDCQPHRGD
jgi:hypothetical protein